MNSIYIGFVYKYIMEYLHENYDLSKKISKKSRKAQKIISILNEFKKLHNCNVLDIGSGTGIIANKLSKHFKKVYGVDVSDYRIIKEGYIFKKINDEKLPFKNKFFDVVISNQVIEHVNDQDKHLNEISRILKDDGICYLATPNKYWIIEPHYYLPFLSILPRKIANIYLRFFENKDYDAYILSYNQLYKILKKYFIINDITIKTIYNSKKYHLNKDFKFIPKSIIKFIPKSILNYLLPSFIMILKKRF